MSDTVRILHVDDEPNFAELTAKLLEEKVDNFDVITATSAEEGLDFLSKHNFDCIVSDYDMPKQNGLEFLNQVSEKHEDLPFILFTGKGSEEVASEAISAGVTDYLQKKSGTDQYLILANRIQNAVRQYRNEMLMEENRERFRTLVEETTDVILVVDSSARITYATPSAKSILGRSPDELVGTSGFEPIHPDDMDKVVEQFGKLVENPEQRQSVEFRYIRPDGSVIWAEARGRNLLDNPIVEGIVVYTREITERKERENKLERYETIIETIDDVAFVVDEDWRIEYVNESGIGYVDMPIEKVIGQKVMNVIRELADDDEDPDRFKQALEKAFESDESESPKRLDFSLNLNLGEADVEFQFSPLIEDEGKKTVIVTRDITERLKRETELREVKEEYETVFNTAQDGIFLLDVDKTESDESDVKFRFKRLNQALEEISGLSTEEVRGKTPREALDDELAEEVVENYRRCFEERRPITYEEELDMPAGAINWQSKLAPVFNEGEVTGIVGVARDITELKLREEELERKNERLEDFASIVSHDLRNPLNVAQGQLGLAREECDSKHLDAVDRAHNRMNDLIEDLLTLSRDRKKAREIEGISLSSIFEDCWRNVDTKDASLVIESDGVVQADKVRLRQLVENLIRNAVEHGGGDVTVKVGKIGSEGFYVEDDGGGIPQEDFEQVFENGYSTSEEGTGFGLSIVKQTAEAHGWDVSVVESEEGGVRFEVTDVEYAS